MDLARLAGMALATVGLVVLLVGRLLGYTLGLYIGLVVVAVGFVVYIMALYRVPKKAENQPKAEGIEKG